MPIGSASLFAPLLAMGPILDPDPGWILEDSAAFPLEPANFQTSREVRVVAAGDVNNDGHADLIVATTDTGVGQARLYLGGAGELSATPAWDIVGPTGGFGFSGDGVGDVNADGFDDVVLCAPFDGATVAGEGLCYLYRGDAAGLEDTPSYTVAGSILGTDINGCCGMGLAVTGGVDLNGDGFDDFALSSRDVTSLQGNPGAALVVYGAADPANFTTSQIWPSYVGISMAHFGHGVTGVPDVDGDGFDELAIKISSDIDALSFEDLTRAYVYLGTGAGPAAPPTWELPNGLDFIGVSGDFETGDNLVAGDFDGDGRSDLALAAWESLIGTVNAEVDVYYARAPAKQSLHWEREWSSDGQGYLDETHVQGFGWLLETDDINDDGYDDLVVSNRNALAVILGSADGLEAHSGAIIQGAAFEITEQVPQGEVTLLVSGSPAIDMAALGDVNGDGFGDVATVTFIIEDPDPQSFAGRTEVRVHYGGDEVCAADADHDTICNDNDNCPASFNPNQLDTDRDGEGDACEFDDPPPGGSSGGGGSTSADPADSSSSGGEPPDASTTGMSEPGTGTGDPETSGLGNDVAEAGCACRSSGGPGFAAVGLLFVGLLGLPIRRRGVT